MKTLMERHTLSKKISRCFNLLVICMLVISILSGGTVNSASVGSSYDFGDAPDGNGYRYPSLVASQGARTTRVDQVWLGKTVDREVDSKQDSDSGDDGVSADLHSCATSNVYVLVHKARRGRVRGMAYVNVFFDWNKDGRWDGSDGCASERAVQNYAIDLNKQKNEIQLYSIPFKGGIEVKDIWFRAMVTLNQKVEAPGGTGVYTSGEVEDYGPMKLKAPENGDNKIYSARCSPDVSIIKHGESVKVVIANNPGSEPFTDIGLANSVQPNNRARAITKTNKSTFNYQSKQKDSPKRVEVDSFQVRVRWGKQASKLVTCTVVVNHDDNFVPPPPPPPDDDDKGPTGGPVGVEPSEYGIYHVSCTPNPLVLKHGTQGTFTLKSDGLQKYVAATVDYASQNITAKPGYDSDSRMDRITIGSAKDGPVREEKGELVTKILWKNIKPGGPDKFIYVSCYYSIHHDDSFVVPPPIDLSKIPKKLTFGTTSGPSVVTGRCSGGVVVERLDQTNNASTTGLTTVYLSSDSSSEQFYSDPSCSHAVSRIPITPGTSQAIFYTKNSSATTATITASQGTGSNDPCEELKRTQNAIHQLIGGTSSPSATIVLSPSDQEKLEKLGQEEASLELQCDNKVESTHMTIPFTTTITHIGDTSTPPSLADRFAFSTGAQSIAADTCSGAISLVTQDSQGNTVSVSSSTTLTLTDTSATGRFYSNAGCTSIITQTTIPSGSSSVTIYFKDTTAASVTLQASATGFTTASQAITISAGTPVALAFVTSAQTVTAGTCSAVVTIQRVDSLGNPASSGSHTINIFQSSVPPPLISVFSQANCTGVLTQLTLSNGVTTGSFYFSGSVAGTGIITINEAGLGNATQTETFN